MRSIPSSSLAESGRTYHDREVRVADRADSLSVEIAELANQLHQTVLATDRKII